MSRPTQVCIDTNALVHNLSKIREVTPHSKILAMVKANAYGHGILSIAKALSDVDALGVASIDEALVLRDGGINNRIVLMEGIFETSELGLVVEHQLDLIIHHQSQLDTLLNNKLTTPINVWLKINTGMHRLGFNETDVDSVWQSLKACPWVNETILMTHLSSAHYVENDFTAEQITRFSAATKNLSGEKCIANSAGILAWPDSHSDWVRPGIILYGVSPFADKVGCDFGLKPVMSLHSQLIAIHHLKKGDQLNYGGHWVCEEDMPVGIVAIGYGDGYPYGVLDGAPVLVNGQKTQVIGRVAMDMLGVDLRTVRDAKLGDPVLLWGENLPVEWIAKAADTIPWALLCGIARRVKHQVK